MTLINMDVGSRLDRMLIWQYDEHWTKFDTDILDFWKSGTLIIKRANPNHKRKYEENNNDRWFSSILKRKVWNYS